MMPRAACRGARFAGDGPERAAIALGRTASGRLSLGSRHVTLRWRCMMAGHDGREGTVSRLE
jgi:hypothetical protein